MRVEQERANLGILKAQYSTDVDKQHARAKLLMEKKPKIDSNSLSPPNFEGGEAMMAEWRKMLDQASYTDDVKLELLEEFGSAETREEAISGAKKVAEEDTWKIEGSFGSDVFFSPSSKKQTSKPRIERGHTQIPAPPPAPPPPKLEVNQNGVCIDPYDKGPLCSMWEMILGEEYTLSDLANFLSSKLDGNLDVAGKMLHEWMCEEDPATAGIIIESWRSTNAPCGNTSTTGG